MTDALTPDMTGRWEVTTRGSVHLWDLDAMTVTKFRGPNSQSVGFRPEDLGVPRQVTTVARWPKVGQSFLVYYGKHFHISSAIRSIEEVTS